jgi:hypothetical protein
MAVVTCESCGCRIRPDLNACPYCAWTLPASLILDEPSVSDQDGHQSVEEQVESLGIGASAARFWRGVFVTASLFVLLGVLFSVLAMLSEDLQTRAISLAALSFAGAVALFSVGAIGSWRDLLRAHEASGRFIQEGRRSGRSGRSSWLPRGFRGIFEEEDGPSR